MTSYQFSHREGYTKDGEEMALLDAVAAFSESCSPEERQEIFSGVSVYDLDRETLTDIYVSYIN